MLNLDNIQKHILKNSNTKSNLKTQIILDETSKEIYKKRKNELAQNYKPELITSFFNGGIVFNISNSKFYLSLDNIKDFQKINPSDITKIPTKRDYIMGLINVKGEYITILDIKKFLGEEKTKINKKAIAIVLRSDEFKIAILADEILENVNINSQKIIKEKKDITPVIEFAKNGEIYEVIDVQALLKDNRLTVT